MIHQLKIKENFYNAIKNEDKRFEIRKNDRGFKEGDRLALNKINEEGKETGESLLVRVDYILDDVDYCKDGYVVMSINLENIYEYGRIWPVKEAEHGTN